MDDLKWYGLLGSVVTYGFFVIREIKEIFFDKDDTGESFGVKLIRAIFLSRKKRKVIEPKIVIYSDGERKVMVDNLLIHNFFISVCRMRIAIANTTFGGSSQKDKILRDVIIIYIDSIEKYATLFLKENQLDKLSTNALNEKLNSEIKRIEYEIYGKLRERLGFDIYNKVIEDPIKGFRTKNAHLKEILIDGVLSISTQSMAVYEYDNYKRASEILTSLYVSLKVIVKNFESVFKDFNGDLEKLIEQNK